MINKAVEIIKMAMDAIDDGTDSPKKDAAYNALKMLIDDLHELHESLQEVSARYPYKVPGQPETYNTYNEGWSDACSAIKDKLEKIF